MKLNKIFYKIINIGLVLLLMTCLFNLNLYGQDKEVKQTSSINALIEASQSGALPLVFEVLPKYNLSRIDGFLSDKEFSLRNGLPNFFHKINQKEPKLTIAFLGGSITKAEDQYRNQTLAFIQSLNPKATLRGINAGVSGTGTELGACRVGEHVLAYQPDLVFVEFAVNGGSNEAMEGIVRQIIKNNPFMDICFVYTIAGEQYQQYIKGDLPAKIRSFETVANHYHIPSIHLGLYPSVLLSQGKLVWKGDVVEQDKILFSKDGTHPLRAGGDLYAQAIARALYQLNSVASEYHHPLIDPIYPDNWENGGMYSPLKIGESSEGFEYINPLDSPSLKAFTPWFSSILKIDNTKTSYTFKFKGTAFGFFDIGGPEVGQVLIEVDGLCAALKRKAGNSARTTMKEPDINCIVNRFNTNCNNRYRGQFELFEVPDGVHEVKITLSDLKIDKVAILQGHDLSDINKNPERYDQHKFYLGKILVKGEIMR